MYEQYKKGQLLSSTFSDQIWREIASELFERCRQQYTVAQLKGKANRIRMLWRKFYDLVHKKTGFGWDPTTCTVTASEERWAEWIMANPREAALRKKGLPHFPMCTEMFSTSVATGGNARSSAMYPLDSNDEGEFTPTGPSIDPVYVSSPSVGPTDSSNPSSKHAGVLDRKAAKSARSSRIDSAIDAWKAVSSAKCRKLENTANHSIQDCMKSLQEMDGLPRHLFFAAQDAFMQKLRRQMFLLMSDADKRAWVESLDK